MSWILLLRRTNWHRTRQEHPDKRSQRSRDDEQLKHEIQRVYDENKGVYGARKVWRQLLRDGFRVARCTVEQLMKIMGFAGVFRGKKVRTTYSRKNAAADDLVNRQFVAERLRPVVGGRFYVWCARSSG
ncbi:IS3 family transposase [Salmonella enterica]